MTYKGTVGLGVTTWKRPELFRRCRDSIMFWLSDVVDHIVVVQDGGPCYLEGCPAGWELVDHGENRGWAPSKNECLDRLVELGCDHLFMVEDDTIVTSESAVTGYVDAAEQSGWHYLTAHPWGEATTTMVEVDRLVTYWAYVGSWWTYMTRQGYLTGGGYNTTLGNTMGDIELPERWRVAGLSSGWGRLADATGSERWVKPTCLTPDQSTICVQPDWQEHQEFALRWWMEECDTPMPPGIRPATEGRASRRCLPADP